MSDAGLSRRDAIRRAGGLALAAAVLTADSAGVVRVRYGEARLDLTLRRGERVRITGDAMALRVAR